MQAATTFVKPRCKHRSGKSKNILWISLLAGIFSQLIFPSVAFAYTYELDSGNPVPDTISRTEKISINNCDNNQTEPYDIKDRLQISHGLSFEQGWKIGAGPEVSIPGVPISVNLDAELSRTVGTEISVVNETNRNLTGNIPAGVHKIIAVDIEDDVLKGTATISKRHWWDRFFPFDSPVPVTSSPYTAYQRRRITKIKYSNISCFAGKWMLDVSQWQETPNLGASPIGGLAGGELNIDDNGGVNFSYLFLYNLSSGNQAEYSIYCREGSLDENGLQGTIQPMFGSIRASNKEYPELKNRYTDLPSVYLTLCGIGSPFQDPNQTIQLPFQIRLKTQANNRVIIMENSEIRSIWYQENE